MLSNCEERERPPGPQRRGPSIVVLSAKNQARLWDYAERIVGFLQEADVDSGGLPIELADVAFTLQVAREAMAVRLATIAEDKEELIEKLSAFVEGRTDREGLYVGTGQAGKTHSSLLAGDDDAREMIAQWIRKGKLARVAQLWVSGVEIDWRLLYADALPRRVGLPTYPFAKDRCWITAAEDAAGPGRSVWRKGADGERPHPLLGANRSTFKGACFGTRLTGEEFYLRDHVVSGRKVVPGAVYLEMARAAGEIAGERKVERIAKITWPRPLVVGDVAREVRVGLVPARDEVEFEVTVGAEGRRPICVASGKLLYARDGGQQDRAPDEPVDIESVKRRCRQVTAKAACYHRFRAHGLEYGPSFQTIRELYSGDTEALSRIELPPALKGGFRGFGLHPALLDGAVQTAAGLIGEETSPPGGLYLPFTLEDVHIRGPLEETCYAHATLAGEGPPSRSSTRRFDVRLLDGQGRTLVEMRDLSLRALPSSKGQKKDPGPESSKTMCFRTVWEESPLPGPSQHRSPPPLDDGRDAPGAMLIFDTG